MGFSASEIKTAIGAYLNAKGRTAGRSYIDEIYPDVVRGMQDKRAEQGATADNILSVHEAVAHVLMVRASKFNENIGNK